MDDNAANVPNNNGQITAANVRDLAFLILDAAGLLRQAAHVARNQEDYGIATALGNAADCVLELARKLNNFGH